MKNYKHIILSCLVTACSSMYVQQSYGMMQVVQNPRINTTGNDFSALNINSAGTNVLNVVEYVPNYVHSAQTFVEQSRLSRVEADPIILLAKKLQDKCQDAVSKKIAKRDPGFWPIVCYYTKRGCRWMILVGGATTVGLTLYFSVDDRINGNCG